MNGSANKLAIVGGGTAGHIYPALAVAEAFREIVDRAEIMFLGTEVGLERGIVPKAGFRLEIVPGSPLFGTDTAGKLRSLRNAMGGMAAAARILKAERIGSLLSFGGYTSAGPVLAARRWRLPVGVCEPNVKPGLANRLLARFADRVFLGSALAAGAFPRDSVVVTGVPIRRLPRKAAGAAHDGVQRLLILGGSLGSSFLNRVSPPLIAEMVRQGCRLEIHHQTGGTNDARVREEYRSRGIEATVLPLVDDVGALYAWADFAITCAGAITLAELACVGLPAFVVPLATASEDHQAANAHMFCEATGCPGTREDEWDTSRIATDLRRLLADGARLARLAERMRAHAVPRAAEAVALAWKAFIEQRR